MLAIAKTGLVAVILLLAEVSCVSEPESAPSTPSTPSASTAPTSTPAIQQKTINDGVFTQAQVASGQRVYDASCKTCHDIRFYRDTLRSWQDRPLLDFWYSILGEMPADNPGSLSDSDYTEVIAYILSEIGYPTGTAVLDPVNGMAQIKIVSL